MNDLNPRQIKFVMNLLKGMNYTQAYKAAGYKPKNDDIAASSASLLIRNPKVKAFWDEQKKKLLELSRSRMIVLAMDALPELQKLMISSKSEAVKLAAAKDILDRAGLQAETKLQVEGKGKVIINFVGLTDEDFPGETEE